MLKCHPPDARQPLYITNNMHTIDVHKQNHTRTNILYTIPQYPDNYATESPQLVLLRKTFQSESQRQQFP